MERGVWWLETWLAIGSKSIFNTISAAQERVQRLPLHGENWNENLLLNSSKNVMSFRTSKLKPHVMHGHGLEIYTDFCLLQQRFPAFVVFYHSRLPRGYQNDGWCNKITCETWDVPCRELSPLLQKVIKSSRVITHGNDVNEHIDHERIVEEHMWTNSQLPLVSTETTLSPSLNFVWPIEMKKFTLFIQYGQAYACNPNS